MNKHLAALKGIAGIMINKDPVSIKSHFMAVAYPELSDKSNERLAQIYDELAGNLPKWFWNEPTPPCPYVDIPPATMRLLYCPSFGMPITSGPFAEAADKTPEEVDREEYLKRCKVN